MSVKNRNPRAGDGRFLPGHRYARATEFKKGQHWRPHQPFRDKDWLTQKYVVEGVSLWDIARMFGVRAQAIEYWLKKHGISRRTVSQARSLKVWGVPGERNGMFGRTGEANPNWRGGRTPERQSMYASYRWRKTKLVVRQRDKACVLCGSTGPWHYHHIRPFGFEPDLVYDVNNVCRLCVPCHYKVYGKEYDYVETLQRKIAGRGGARVR